LLWSHLRARVGNEAKFRRQHPIGPYIADFICLEEMVIIELDGASHKTKRQQDIERDAWLNKSGYRVLRFWNSNVLKNTEGVLNEIKKALRSGRSPSPRPSPLKGEGAYKVSVDPKEYR
jgi:very-short-patch-repair endonuclease